MIFESENLKLKFDGYSSIKRNFSQAGQDLFVLSMLNGKRKGVFLDLGCSEPIYINNTYLLENSFDWRGLSVDINPEYFKLYVFRKTKTLNADCTELDWDNVLKELGTNSIDYLSLDLEPPNVTLKCLKSIPFEKVEFSIITFEHDAYRSKEAIKIPSRRFLESKGYRRVCSNVMINGFEFEDWYCNPNKIDKKRINLMLDQNKNWEEIIFQ